MALLHLAGPFCHILAVFMHHDVVLILVFSSALVSMIVVLRTVTYEIIILA